MPVRKTSTEKSEAQKVVTPDTLSAVAAQTELPPLDDKTALIIKLCEGAARADYESELGAARADYDSKSGALKVKLVILTERYRAILRELQERQTSLGFDDFLKIMVGIVGGYLVREIAGVGLDAFKNAFVLVLTLTFIIGSGFLVYRHCSNRGRKAEIAEEIHRLRDDEGRL